MRQRSIIRLMFMHIIEILKQQIGFKTVNYFKGQVSSRQLHLIQAWIEIHQDELLANWVLCQNG